MTCIVGLVGKDGVVHLGGDAAAVSDLDLTVRADVKVFRNGPYVIGFIDSFRAGQILRYAFKPPAPPPGCDLLEFMVTAFVDALRASLQAAGVASRSNETETGASFLVGVSGRLFSVGEDYQVGEAADKFDALGCGAPLALGALYATGPFLEPRPRLRVALEAAERGSGGVRRPFSYVRTR